MKITVLCVGKIKEDFYRMAVAEYAKRLGRYCNLQMIEVADEKTPDSASAAEEERIKEKEGERLLLHLRDDMHVIALAIDGREMDSTQMAGHMERLMLDGKSHAAFVIGGSLGLAKRVLQRADEQISFSKMTFPHQLMRVILLEQVYRSYRIMRHEPYHK